MSMMEMIDMSALIRDILDAVSFGTAFFGFGWLCILIGEKWGRK